jgi:tripartite ATP-independent transporter DctM subunit
MPDSVAGGLITSRPVTPFAAAFDRRVRGPLLLVVEVVAAVMLVADLGVVAASVLLRYMFAAPLVWSDDVARALLLGLSFLGAAAALARGENAGIAFFVDRLSAWLRAKVDVAAGAIIIIVAVSLCLYTIVLLQDTTGQTVGSGVPENWFFIPMGLGAAAMAVFGIGRLAHHPLTDIAVGIGGLLLVALLFAAWTFLAPDSVPDTPWLMLVAFVVTLCGGVPIAFVLALTSLVYIWCGGVLPGEIFAQQMARGIDNFVLLAVPFFILVGYLMEANGMSVRLIALLQRGVGRMRGGLNVVMVLSMVIFSGISGSKMADVAAVGAVLIPAARKSRQNPGEAVALLAASAVMAETIPPCINLIILGFVTNLSIGGLFAAGLVPAGLMALVLIIAAIVFGNRVPSVMIDADEKRSLPALIGSGVVAFGLIALVFGGFRSGFATATEISAFAVFYALFVGGLAFRELSWRRVGSVLANSAVRAGMVLFIVAAAQSLAYSLTLQQIPQELANLMVELSGSGGAWLFLLLSIFILIIMGSMLEGAAALIIFGPLLMPVARQLGVDPLHYAVMLVIGMGIGLFAPPLGLGLYSSCLIGNVRLEDTVRPILKYLGVLFLCLVLIAFVPMITTALPRALGY